MERAAKQLKTSKAMGNNFSSRDTEIKSWFPALVGIGEEAFAALSEEERTEKFFRLDEAGNVRLMRGGSGKPNDKDVNCGRFEVVSVGELAKGHKKAKQACSLTFVTRKDADPLSLQCVDVAHLQSLPANRGAMFQVASNMNAVEGISQETSVEEKTFVSDYIYDKTQGPAASISAGGAAVTRVYAAWQVEGKMERQRRDKQINFVEELGELCSVVNGYVQLTPLSEEQFSEHFSDKKDAIIDSIKVGIHANCQVTFGRRTPQLFPGVPESEKQIIHQTFGAAVNMGQGVSGIANRKCEKGGEISHAVLQAMYRGCLLAAKRLNCTRVFLTLLGGGVFANSTHSIIAALTESVVLFGSGLEVVVIMYSPTPLTEELAAAIDEGMKGEKWSYKCAVKGVVEMLH